MVLIKICRNPTRCLESRYSVTVIIIVILVIIIGIVIIIIIIVVLILTTHTQTTTDQFVTTANIRVGTNTHLYR